MLTPVEAMTAGRLNQSRLPLATSTHVSAGLEIDRHRRRYDGMPKRGRSALALPGLRTGPINLEHEQAGRAPVAAGERVEAPLRGSRTPRRHRPLAPRRDLR